MITIPMLDFHTHTISSGHGTHATITDMAAAARKRNLKALGLSDHGPATAGSAKISYFRSLASGPRQRCGVDIYYGVELNILDDCGTIDLPDDVLQTLDYGIISMHLPNRAPGSAASNTDAYLAAMEHPKVKIVGHWDDTRYPIEPERFLRGCIQYNVIPEINNSSLSPKGYRGDTREANVRLLELCMKYQYPVILSSDSHGPEHIGDFSCILPLLESIHFPTELVVR